MPYGLGRHSPQFGDSACRRMVKGGRDILIIKDEVSLTLSLLNNKGHCWPEAAVAGLAEFPEHGAYLRELIALGIRDYRQTAFKPNRVIYRAIGHKAFICVIADGRRDLQSLLTRCLLGA